MHPLLLLLPLLACKKDPGDSGAWTAPGCGDGVLADDEECDEGDANSDTAPDACRTDCLLPVCGDGVVDADEACDDGNAVGGDGCAPACTTEDGALEAEPNDDSPQDTAFPVHGSLSEGDVDCFALAVDACASVAAWLEDPCDTPATLTLLGPDGTELATGSPGEAECPAVDPVEHDGARFLPAGTAAVCVEGLLGAPVAAYTLDVETTPLSAATWTVPTDGDDDGDGQPGRCDLDDDGDGIDDVDDDCPDLPNNGDELPLSPDADGFLTTWLAAGPFGGVSSSSSCLPTDEQWVAGDLAEDGQVRPALADPAGDTSWRVLWGEARVDFSDFMGIDAPREVYVLVYVYSDEDQDVTLALGPDDGAVAWLDGQKVLEIDGCQGTNVDQYQVPVTLLAGWQPLMIKVYDQGGGWGVYARFLDGAGAPVTDLTLSLDPDGLWAPGQGDADGDGLGDVCDPEP